MRNIARHISKKKTPQTRRARADQHLAAGGGYVFSVDDWKALDRFLILGTEGGSYYVGEQALTIEMAGIVEKCLTADYVRCVDRIVEVSEKGLAFKQEPVLLALAVAGSWSGPPAAHGVDNVVGAACRQRALAALPRVCRIPTHLFHFLTYVQELRGWGRALRRAVAQWYILKGGLRLGDRLLTKYQSRDGWSNRDALRLSHPKGGGVPLRWAVDGLNEAPERTGAHARLRRAPLGPEELTPTIRAFEAAKTADKPTLLRLIAEGGLEREHIPTAFLKDPDIWEALLPSMGLTALLRNLGNMSAVGLLRQLSSPLKTVCDRLTNKEDLVRARIHPMAVLTAAAVYSQGHGVRGSQTWEVAPRILGALDAAFALSFKNLVPTGRRLIVAVDMSGSMTAAVHGSVALTSAQAAAAWAFLLASTEADVALTGFDTETRGFRIPPNASLTQILATTAAGGGTDCAVPLKWALSRKIEADAFILLTDGETWAGDEHYYQALANYRNKINPKCLSIQAATAANLISLTPIQDPLSMSVCGFDSSVPEVIARFVRGEV